MFEVNNRVVLITGGLGAIGLAISKEFLKNGAKGVTLLDVEGKNSENILADISKEFGKDKVIFFKTDITQENQVWAAFEKTIEKWKSVNVVVNCAGIIQENNVPRVMDVNLISAHRIMLLAMEKYFSGQQDNLIVNISSIGGLDPSHVVPVYSASKSALIAFGRSYGSPYFYEKYKTRVITVCPGVTDTPLVRENASKTEDDMMGEFKKAAEFLPCQKPESVGQQLMFVIKEGKNGSVWVIEADLPYEIIFKGREASRKEFVK